MKRSSVVWAVGAWAVMAALLVGCGGGGGGASTGGSGGGGGTGSAAREAGQYMEFVNGSGAVVDPMNFNQGQVVQAVIANYDPSGNRSLIPATGYTISGAGASGVSLTPTGQLVITTAGTGRFNVRVTTTVAGTNRTFDHDGFAPGPGATNIVRGAVVNSAGVPIVGIQVELFDDLGNLVGGGVTGPGGSFNSRTTATGRRLTMRPQTVPPSLFRALQYQGKNYALAGVTCTITLPATAPGAQFQLPANLVLVRQLDGPPPPPDGCQ